jgi:hypothetical protein
VLITCALVDPSAGAWVVQRLLLAIAGESRDRGLIALEAFATPVERPDAPHLVPLPRTELEEIGFVVVRESGPVALMRLDLRGLITVPVREPSLLDRVREEIAERRGKRLPARY